MNVSQKCELALKNAIIAAGISQDDCYYNLFQESDNANNPDHEVIQPQILIQAAPDVPDGMETDGVSNLRRVSVLVRVMTLRVDDKTHETLAANYEKVRTAIDGANASLTTWSSSYLPSGWSAQAVMVEDGAAYFDDEVQAIELTVGMEVCIA